MMSDSSSGGWSVQRTGRRQGAPTMQPSVSQEAEHCPVEGSGRAWMPLAMARTARATDGPIVPAKCQCRPNPARFGPETAAEGPADRGRDGTARRRAAGKARRTCLRLSCLLPAACLPVCVHVICMSVCRWLASAGARERGGRDFLSRSYYGRASLLQDRIRWVRRKPSRSCSGYTVWGSGRGGGKWEG